MAPRGQYLEYVVDHGMCLYGWFAGTGQMNRDDAGSLPVMPILFACDLTYLQHACACIASLLENSPGYRFDVTIVGTQDFTAAAKRVRESFHGNSRVRIEFHNFQLPSDIFFPLHFHYTSETYIRFWIGDLLARHGRALYLDPDIIVTGDVGPLWEMDLDGRTVAAVPIPASTRPIQHGMPAGSLFFNAGVILFDLDAWRAKGYKDICLKYLAENPDKALDSDQDILNLCLIDDWVPLPYVWNVISAFYFPTWHDTKLSSDELAAVRRDARIIHFNGGAKPWSYDSRHPRKDLYWKYLRRTEWRDARPSDYTIFRAMKRAAAGVLPVPLKNKIKTLMRV